MLRTSIRAVLVAAALLVVAPASFGAGLSPDQIAIRDLMRGTFDKPDAPLVVEPIVVRGNHAVAGWEQGESGGRALLRRLDGKWLIWLCSGDALKNPRALTEMGVPQADAGVIAQNVVAEEAKLPPVKRERFSKFDGVVMVQGSDDRSHQGQHGTHNNPATH